ncbi:hypothetical protein [Pseudoalteromonas phenolica]|uniref:Uncharacterized protein n=1 Tax=Pseudoalteromonas phenolica TaxID=161398 RepID=A0A0S2JX53_9GAMM|nr:hypothetical protein [Pseudoalteromonas phenolica]ALO40704.1 hypothetical protein PP2015_176 [Pseudoalteromonas phenolica]MBE0354780.1 hypothetical protein [Pseudoalteromonas phenolica O-BC30]RXE93499.1 hypothetical protein D9981_20540 [Pseudoalteromonas phenolica O-BC30]
MGVRSQLRRELMNLEANGLMTADDVRMYLMQSKELFRQTGLSLVARFNAHHNKVLAGLPSHEKGLEHQQHKLFKEVLYPRNSVQSWLSKAH